MPRVIAVNNVYLGDQIVTKIKVGDQIVTFEIWVTETETHKKVGDHLSCLPKTN